MPTTARGTAPAVGDLRRELVRSLAAPVGGALAIGLPMALVPLRGVIPRTALVAIVAALVAVVTGVGGLRAGAVGAAMAAMSTDMFLTAPYGRLRPDRLDLWTTAAALGVVVLGAALATRNRGR